MNQSAVRKCSPHEAIKSLQALWHWSITSCSLVLMMLLLLLQRQP